MSRTNNTKLALWVAIGSFFSFLVGVVTPMILSRYFTKTDYGTYKQVMYVYNSLLVIFSLGLPKAYAYFLPRVGKEEAKDVVNKITRIFVLLGVFFSLILLLSSNIIAQLLNNDDLSPAIRYFSIYPLFILPTLGIDGIFATYRRTKYLAYYTVITRLFTIAFSVLPVLLFNGTYIHAIIGMDIAGLFTFILAIYLRNLPLKGWDSFSTKIKYSDIIRFSLPLFYASIWGLIIKSSSQFFISRYYGTEEFADFSNGFMDLPFLGMIVASVSTVLLPSFSKMDIASNQQKESLALWKSTIYKSVRIISPMLIFSVFFSNLLMICMYGDLYNGASIYFVIKNLGALFYVAPYAPIILAIGETKKYAAIHMITALLIVITQGLAVYLGASSVVVAVIFVLYDVSAIIALMRIISDYYCLSIVKIVPVKLIGKVLLVSLLAGFLAIFLSKPIDANKYTLLLICVCLFLILYYFLCLIFKVTYTDIVRSILPRLIYNRMLKFIP